MFKYLNLNLNILEFNDSSILDKVSPSFPALFPQHTIIGYAMHIDAVCKSKARASLENMKGFESHSRSSIVAPFFIQKD